MSLGRTRARIRSHLHPGGGALPPVLWSADFTTLTPGAVATLPGSLVLTRASAATVQTGTSTVVTAGIGTDVARAGRRLDADTIGLVLEAERTNGAFNNSRNSTRNNAGTGTETANQTGPDGTANAARDAIGAGQYSTYWQNPLNGPYTVGQPVTWSVWAKLASGSAPGRIEYNSAGWGQVAVTVGAAWGRVSYTTNATTTSNLGLIPTTGRDGTARDNYTDLGQIESGAWASEAIVTTTGSATRAGERLYLASAAPYVNAGRLTLAISCRPKAARDKYAAAMRVWTSGTDYAEINPTTGVMTVSIGGSTNTTAAITGSALGNVSTAGALDLLCNGTSNQLSAWITRMAAYRANQRPAWAT